MCHSGATAPPLKKHTQKPKNVTRGWILESATYIHIHAPSLRDIDTGILPSRTERIVFQMERKTDKAVGDCSCLGRRAFGPTSPKQVKTKSASPSSSSSSSFPPPPDAAPPSLGHSRCGTGKRIPPPTSFCPRALPSPRR